MWLHTEAIILHFIERCINTHLHDPASCPEVFLLVTIHPFKCLCVKVLGVLFDCLARHYKLCTAGSRYLPRKRDPGFGGDTESIKFHPHMMMHSNRCPAALMLPHIRWSISKVLPKVISPRTVPDPDIVFIAIPGIVPKFHGETWHYR